MKPKAAGKVTVTRLRVGGDVVSVGRDEAGRLITSTGFWVDPAGANERVAHSNIRFVKAMAVGAQALEDRAKALEAKAAAEAGQTAALAHVQDVRDTLAEADKARTNRSAETRRAKAKAHWSNEWLAAAYQHNPKLGAARLAQAARKSVAASRPEITPEKRDEITEYRAGQYLQTRSK